MSFEVDFNNSYLRKAAELRDAFAVNATLNDKRGGQPLEQVKLLKESGLLNIMIPKEYGGEGQPWAVAMRVVREFAKVDGSMAHLYGYHLGPQHGAYRRANPELTADLYRRSLAGNWLWSNSSNPLSPTLLGRDEGEWIVLNGFKPFSSGTHVADYILVSWNDAVTNEWRTAAIPAEREGLVVEHDWDGIGQRQTGSGRVSYHGVKVHHSERIVFDGSALAPFQTFGTLHQQSTLLNVFVGTAQGALAAARDYTVSKSSPWLHSGVTRHIDDPWIKRQYGELYALTAAATALADKALVALDEAWNKGPALTEPERGEAAIVIASANLFAGKAALKVSSEIFEVMGARSAVAAHGFDRFWRNVRTHTLHNPAEYKARNLGTWYLTGEHPEALMYQ